jgi:hypothetical protein
MAGVLGMLCNLDSWSLWLNSHRAAISPCTGSGADTRTMNPRNDNAHFISRRCENDVFGGQGRNQTTDTRLFKVMPKPNGTSIAESWRFALGPAGLHGLLENKSITNPPSLVSKAFD